MSAGLAQVQVPEIHVPVRYDMENSIDLNVPQMADGGIVSKPTLALIGEAGPEAVVPLPGSAGYARQSHAAHAAMGGGGDLVVLKVGSDAAPEDVWAALPDRLKRNYKGLRTQLIQAIS
jgi:hypothetical protein